MNRTQLHHYHICWSGKEALDWEALASREDAEASAKQLVRFGETYTIEEHDQTCSRCAAALNLKKIHDAAPEPVSPLKYGWQQVVSEAFTETRREFVAWKVNAAQRAISARLCDQSPATPDEQIAIREALASLRALLLDRKLKQSEEKTNSGSKSQVA